MMIRAGVRLLSPARHLCDTWSHNAGMRLRHGLDAFWAGIKPNESALFVEPLADGKE